MMNRSGIETYELLRLDEVALAGYFDLEDTRFEEWYEKNRAVGDRLYSAILDRKIDLVAFRGTEDGRYYSILTRSPKQEGALQLTDIDCRGPIGHRRLTNQKMLDLPGYGAVLAAVPDISKVRNRVAVRIVIENRNVSGLRFIYSLALSNNRVEHLCVSGTCDRWKLINHTARKTRAAIKHVDDNTGNAEIRIQTLVAANRVDAFLDIGESF